VWGFVTVVLKKKNRTSEKSVKKGWGTLTELIGTVSKGKGGEWGRSEFTKKCEKLNAGGIVVLLSGSQKRKEVRGGGKGSWRRELGGQGLNGPGSARQNR